MGTCSLTSSFSASQPFPSHKFTMADIPDPNYIHWSNDDNWTWGVYACQDDSRPWVPKRVPWMGWTVNAGHPYGKPTLAAFGALALGAVATAVSFSLRAK